MIDPFSALAIAASAVSNAKSLIMAGRDATSAMSQFAGAVSDVNYAAEKAKNPGIFASFSGSAEQAAVDAFSAQKKVQAMRKEIEMLIQFQHGPSGLEEYKQILRSVRAQRQKTAYRREEIKHAIINWIAGIIIVAIAVGTFGIVLYYIGKKQGKW